MTDCLFCSIVKGDVPSSKVYEDDKFIVVLDINPGAEGHLLLLTKEHHQVMPQIPDEITAQMALITKKLSSLLLNVYKTKGVSIFAANGFVAGQKAPHFMLHLIPRKETDDISLNLTSDLELSDEDIIELKNSLSSEHKEEVKQEGKANLDKIAGMFDK